MSAGFTHPLQRGGTSQLQRRLPALAPESVPVDERRLEDDLVYVRGYSRLLRYTTPENLPGGDWLELIAGDPSLQVAEIATTDLDALRRLGSDAFDGLRATLTSAPPDPAELAAAFDRQLRVIDSVVRDFDRRYRRALPELGLRSLLARWIRAVFNDALRGAVGVALRLLEVGLAVEELPGEELGEPWNLDSVVADPSLFSSGTAADPEEAEAVGEHLYELFQRLVEGLAGLREATPDLLAESLERWPAHPPHMALLLAFLDLLSHARDQINALTRSHLDFYYRRVLGLAPRAAEPDRAHVVFGLARGTGDHLLEAGVALKAGKDARGVTRGYSTNDDLVIRRTALDPEHGLQTIFVDRDDTGAIRNIYAAPDADSADGLGAALDREGKWPAFGHLAMPFARLGFAVASSMFLLSEGDRTVTLTFRLATAPAVGDDERSQIEEELAANLEVQASGEGEWIEVEITGVTYGPDDLVFELEIAAGEPAILAYDPEALDGGFSTREPVIRFLLDNHGLSHHTLETLAEATRSAGDDESSLSKPANPRRRIVDIGEARRELVGPQHLLRLEGTLFVPSSPFVLKDLPFRRGLLQKAELSYPYKHLQHLVVEGLSIEVDVRGLRALVLENDIGLLEPAKPFLPFGPVPRRGSSFLIGSHEVFHKPLQTLCLKLRWGGLPEESFSTHYEKYFPQPEDNRITGNEHFKVDVEILRDGEWSELEEDVPLFADSAETDDGTRAASARDEPADPPPAVEREIPVSFPPLGRDHRLVPFRRFSPALRRGFLRLRLEQSFLHDLHPLVLARAVVGTDAKPENIPNAPYTPLVASFEVGYSAKHTLTTDDLRQGRESLTQIGPFGHLAATPRQQDSAEETLERHLVPRFPVGATEAATSSPRQPAEGTLLIGLENVEPPQVLSLLVQVAEGSEDPQIEPAPIVWSYLRADRWVELATPEILADGTRGFLQSGIVRLSLPEAMSPSRTLLPAGRFWLKASLESGSAGTAKLIAIHPQATTARFRDRGNDPRHLESPLPAGSIDRLEKRRAQVKTVEQPYASFGGRPREADSSFDTRASERLRHRGRAVSIWDFERLVLERFPEVYKVRCLSHTRGDCEHAPGHVRLVVLPDLRNKNAVDPLEPRLSRGRLRGIEDDLRPLATDFLRIAVTNPDYEKVRVSFDVRFHLGHDDGFSAGRLGDEIIGFLSPWLFSDAADLALGGRIHRSSILDFVEDRDYVDFVRDFRLDHQLADGSWNEDVVEAVASRSSVALVSAAEHDVRPGAASCLDDVAEAEAGEAPFLGNPGTHELHDLRHLDPRCQVDEIAAHRRIPFSTLQGALDAGFDFCAYCFGRARSGR